MLHVRYILPAMMMCGGVEADTMPEAAKETAFNIAPVHWDKNIAVVDVCGGKVAGMSDALPWPESTGELLKLMDALKYEYETRCFQCVVFSMDAAAEGEAAQKALGALAECVTVCDMLRIPLRIAMRQGEEWLEIAPTYSTQTASHLMLEEDGHLSFYSDENKLLLRAASVAEMQSSLKTLAEQGTVVNVFWKPQAVTFSAFLELVQLCHSLGVEYALMLQP